MPTYDYECQACDHEFELFQPITASPVRKCPKCGKLKVKRLIGAGAGIIFKGSGFYCTDYRGDGYTKAKNASESPKTDTKADAKSESKSEAKSDSAKSDASPKAEKPSAKSDKPASKSGKSSSK